MKIKSLKNSQNYNNYKKGLYGNNVHFIISVNSKQMIIWFNKIHLNVKNSCKLLCNYVKIVAIIYKFFTYIYNYVNICKK